MVAGTCHVRLRTEGLRPSATRIQSLVAATAKMVCHSSPFVTPVTFHAKATAPPGATDVPAAGDAHCAIGARRCNSAANADPSWAFLEASNNAATSLPCAPVLRYTSASPDHPSCCDGLALTDCRKAASAAATSPLSRAIWPVTLAMS